ncbi:hypothetical protein MHPYR_640028 [uncultured Mycobacterium sp.]|uniref:Uncharacterized protein n=1 Tax=uncultured Mycobacterium sp. TaxID=171292 RepID=A0A1Y5P122_9MYCO|nr:hypothetical protein MHPYR_100171 [uncultured Mycobacterium sp.]SBS78925.1 hypothetical protein MHPYR_640028 [uncultured Mycobacterium sp.]
MSAPGRIRTCGLLLRRQTLYPLSYGGAPTAAPLGSDSLTHFNDCPDRARGDDSPVAALLPAGMRIRALTTPDHRMDPRDTRRPRRAAQEHRRRGAHRARPGSRRPACDGDCRASAQSRAR